MIENRPLTNVLCHVVLIIGVIFVAFPLYIALVTATLTAQQAIQVPLPFLPGGNLWSNLVTVWQHGTGDAAYPFRSMMTNSFIMAVAVTIGKLVISVLSAFAIVYFRFPLRSLVFWAIFVTLMLPVEVRIFPTVSVISHLHLINTYTGLIVPLIASATSTFLFRQFFMSLPNELIEAARVDGAGPMRFFWDIALPLTKTVVAALLVIDFIYGWNQYLWPILATNVPQMITAVVGVKAMMGNGDVSTAWQLVMAATLLTMLPPLAVVIVMQRWFVRGLVEQEK
ncbi:MAG: sn-glycerol-3-phosphate ABC transporter permease UgpE [Candidatus Eremiobacteraeota bacterium]|nr:sn-glycerol-3-phosphate ABC transporter permease UgpE [Candidatus Eremiobacteraeota bacterium]